MESCNFVGKERNYGLVLDSGSGAGSILCCAVGLYAQTEASIADAAQALVFQKKDKARQRCRENGQQNWKLNGNRHSRRKQESVGTLQIPAAGYLP